MKAITKKITKEAFLASLPFSVEGKKPVEHQTVFESVQAQINRYASANGIVVDTTFQVANSKHTLSDAEVMELPIDGLTKHPIIPDEAYIHRKAIVSFRMVPEAEITTIPDLKFMVMYIMDLETSRCTIARGTEVTVCSNGNILGATDIRSKTISKMPELMDGLNFFLSDRQNMMISHNYFAERLREVYLEGNDYHRVISELYHSSILDNSQIIDLSVLNNAIRECENKHNKNFKTELVDGQPQSTLWNVYNNVTESLKKENTVNDRAKKHINASVMFKNLAEAQMGKKLFEPRELVYLGVKEKTTDDN
jgi:hypothetical protein